MSFCLAFLNVFVGMFWKVLFRVDESALVFASLSSTELPWCSGLRDEPSKSSVSRRREHSFQKKVVFRVDETQLVVFKVVFCVDETSTCKGKFFKSSVLRRRNKHF